MRILEQNQPGTFTSSALPGMAVRVKVDGEEGEEVSKVEGTDGKPETVLPRVADGSVQQRESERLVMSDRLAGSKVEDKRKGKGGERKSKLLKKLGRKEKGKKGRKVEEKVADDAQSEFSYGQPDTDLSRSKASKRAFSECRTFTILFSPSLFHSVHCHSILSIAVSIVTPFSIPMPLHVPIPFHRSHSGAGSIPDPHYQVCGAAGTHSGD